MPWGIGLGKVWRRGFWSSSWKSLTPFTGWKMSTRRGWEQGQRWGRRRGGDLVKFPNVKELSSSSRPRDKFQDCIHSLISLLVFHFIQKFRLLLMWLRSELKMWIKLCMQCMTWMMSLLLQYKLAGFSLAKAGWGTSPIGQSTVRRIDPLQTSLYFHSSARVSNSWGKLHN